MWMGLALSYLLLLRASDLFEEDREGSSRNIFLEERKYHVFSRGPPGVWKQSGSVGQGGCEVPRPKRGPGEKVGDIS